MRTMLNGCGVAGLLALLLVAGCSKEKPAAVAPPAAEVGVITVALRDVPLVYDFVGQTQSSQQVEIRARVNGFLEKRVYTEGALVKTGETLFLMDPKPFEATLKAAEAVHEETGLSCEVIDLRTLQPFDWPAIEASVKKTGRALVVYEDTLSFGYGAEIAAIIADRCFEWLDAPVRVLGALDTPVPYAPPLEEFFLVSEGEIEKAARLLAAY